MYTRPLLFTFDVFGTLVDWRRGLAEAAARVGRPLREGEFDRIVDRQGVLEQEQPGRTYREITRLSLVDVLGLDAAEADAIGAEVGTWPPYPDAPSALRRLMALAPCVATTNSDRLHGEQAQGALGLRLSGWLCAEELGCYKPDLRVWHEASVRLGIPPGPAWWHVSAYADYDLDPADLLGLTPVFVRRPHSRPGRAEIEVDDLAALAELVEGIR
jgi:2-haloacid dehalogenase